MKIRTAIFASLMSMTASQAAEAPPGAMACSGCHAGSTGVDTPVPGLVGQKADDILAAMLAFRTGTRPATVMDRIARSFSEPEAAAIAQWYAKQAN